MNKTIWMIWFQGEDKMPEICKLCKSVWLKKNKNWNLIFITNSNIIEYIPPTILKKFEKIRPIQCYADLVKLYLMYNYGGLYVDATVFCNKPLDTWIFKSLIKGTFVQWDFDSKLPTINFLYSDLLFNEHFDISENFENELGKGYFKIPTYWSKNILHLKNKILKSQHENFGKSSNNTKPKLGVKIIANSFKLMNQAIDKKFEEAIKAYPYFKLTWKGVPKGKLEDVFCRNSKLIKLVKS